MFLDILAWFVLILWGIGISRLIYFVWKNAREFLYIFGSIVLTVIAIAASGWSFSRILGG